MAPQTKARALPKAAAKGKHSGESIRPVAPKPPPCRGTEPRGTPGAITSTPKANSTVPLARSTSRMPTGQPPLSRPSSSSDVSSPPASSPPTSRPASLVPSSRHSTPTSSRPASWPVPRPVLPPDGPPPHTKLPTKAAPADSTGRSRTRGRPRGPFTQHRRLDTLRALLERFPKGLTIYQLASELGVTPISLRRYLAEVRRELDLVLDHVTTWRRPALDAGPQ